MTVPGLRDAFDGVDAGDHRGRDEGQLGGLAGEALAVGDGQEIRPESCRSLTSSPAWLEADRPSTATIAATPIAIPSAESPARSRRVRSPTLATRARSEARSLRGARSAAPACSRVGSATALTARSLGLPGASLTSANAAGLRVLDARLDDVAALRVVGGEGRRNGDPAGAGLDLDRVGVRDVGAMVGAAESGP